MIDHAREEFARYMALEYHTVIEPDDCGEDGPCYFARHPELLGCASHGANPEEARANLDDARELYLSTLLENGITPPSPSRSRVGAISDRGGEADQD